MKTKDERTKFTNEVLSKIKVVKPWDDAMIRKITELRRKEVNLIKKAQLTLGIVDASLI